MKNLIRKFPNILELDFIELPEDRNRYEWHYWHYRGGPNHPVDLVFPWDRARRLLERNVGKSFDETFSKFCSQVPKYQQKEFMWYFQNYRWHNPEFYVDDDGNIQYVIPPRKYRGPYYWYSPDYKVELRHKITGELPPKYLFQRKGKYAEENYVKTVVRGYKLTFESRNDPRYRRLQAEKYKAYRKEARERKKLAAQRVYSFLSKEERELKKDKLTDLIKIEAHGFDPITSFRKEKE